MATEANHGTTSTPSRLTQFLGNLSRSTSHESLPGELEHPSAKVDHRLPTIHTHPQYISAEGIHHLNHQNSPSATLVYSHDHQKPKSRSGFFSSWFSISSPTMYKKEHQDGDRKLPSRWKSRLPRYVAYVTLFVFAIQLVVYSHLLPSITKIPMMETQPLRRQTPEKSNLMLHLETTAREKGIDIFAKQPITIQSSSAAEKKLAPYFEHASVTRHLPAGKRYMLYMYHSGLNNQRVALANAILIAHTLNLTLVIPPAILGDPVPHREFPLMNKLLAATHRSNLEALDCQTVRNRRNVWKDLKFVSCLDERQRWNRMFMDWKDLFSLRTVKEFGVDMMTLDQFMKEAQVDVRNDIWMDPFVQSGEMMTFEDTREMWSYRFSENGYKPPSRGGGQPKPDQPRNQRQLVTLGKYRGPMLNLTSLRDELHENRHIRMVHFGSIFGSDRVIMASKTGLELMDTVDKALVYTSRPLLDVSNRIIDELGGQSTYVGLHMRIGEMRLGGEMFWSQANQTINSIVGNLTDYLEKESASLMGSIPPAKREALKPSKKDKLKHSGNHEDMILVGALPQPHRSRQELLAAANKVEDPDAVPHPSTVKEPQDLLRVCKMLSDQHIRLYIATDAMDARSNEAFANLFSKWPCTFLMNDFKHMTNDLSVEGPIEFDGQNLVPKRKFSPQTSHLLIPLIDQLVASQGKAFFGTPKSTFSMYCAKLHHRFIIRDEPDSARRRGLWSSV